MKNRVKKIIDKKQLTSSKFADIIGIQRSSVSHILSGRNKTSLDIVKKILTKFKDINPDWLLFGEGNMYKEEKTVVTNVKKTKASEKIVEEKQPEIIEQKNEVLLEEKESNNNIVTNVNKESEKTDEPLVLKDNKNPEKILILFPDNTFSTYNAK